MKPEDIFPLTPVADLVARAWGKFTPQAQIPTVYDVLRRLYNAKKTWSISRRT
jgi:hypothetical protein